MKMLAPDEFEPVEDLGPATSMLAPDAFEPVEDLTAAYQQQPEVAEMNERLSKMGVPPPPGPDEPYQPTWSDTGKMSAEDIRRQAAYRAIETMPLQPGRGSQSVAGDLLAQQSISNMMADTNRRPSDSEERFASRERMANDLLSHPEKFHAYALQVGSMSNEERFRFLQEVRTKAERIRKEQGEGAFASFVEGVGDTISRVENEQAPEQRAFPEFSADLMNAMLQGKPSESEKYWTRSSYGAGRTFPDLVIGVSSSLGGGRPLAALYWESRIAPDRIKQMKAAGLTDNEAEWAGHLSAAIEAGIETLVLNPFKTKTTGIGTQSVADAIVNALKTYGEEVIIEEGGQGLTAKGVEAIATRLNKDAPDTPWEDVLNEAVVNIGEAAGPMALMMAPGGAVNVTRQAVARRPDYAEFESHVKGEPDALEVGRTEEMGKQPERQAGTGQEGRSQAKPPIERSQAARAGEELRVEPRRRERPDEPEPKEGKVSQAQAKVKAAWSAMESYRKRKMLSPTSPLLEHDVEYKRLKGEWESARRSLISSEASQSKKAIAIKRKQAKEKAKSGAVDQETIKYAELHLLPDEVRTTIQDEARFLIGKAKSEKTKAALQKIIDDAGKDKGGDVEKQKARIVDILTGKNDQRTSFQKRDIGVPERPPDPIIELFTEKDPTRKAAMIGEAREALASDTPNDLVMRIRSYLERSSEHPFGIEPEEVADFLDVMESRSGAKAETVKRKVYRTEFEPGKRPGLEPQRSSGFYVALDGPFLPGEGKTSQIDVEYDPKKIFDPNGVLEGTDSKASSRNIAGLIYHMNRVLSENPNRKAPDVRKEVLKGMGYEGEAGWIDGPEGKNRELVLFDYKPQGAAQVPPASPRSEAKQGKNPDFNRSAFDYQNKNIEQLPKNMENRDLGLALEASGDIFRELTEKPFIDRSYIAEKIRRIDSILRDAEKSGDPNFSMVLYKNPGDTKLVEALVKGFGSIKNLGARAEKARALSIAIASGDTAVARKGLTDLLADYPDLATKAKKPQEMDLREIAKSVGVESPWLWNKAKLIEEIKKKRSGGRAVEPEKPKRTELPEETLEPGSEFPGGSAGIVAGRMPSIGDSWERIKSWAIKWFKPGGHAKQEMIEADRRRKGFIEEQAARAMFLMTDLKKAAKEVRKAAKHVSDIALARKLRTQSSVEGMDYAMKTDTIQELPEPLRNAVQSIRDRIKAGGEMLIEVGAADGELARKIRENADTYLHRSYDAFNRKRRPRRKSDMPKVAWDAVYRDLETKNRLLEEWRNVEPEELNRLSPDERAEFDDFARLWGIEPDGKTPRQVLSYLRNVQTLSGRNQIEGYMQSLLDKAFDAGHPLVMAAQTGAKNLDIFKSRKNIPKIWRDFYGEYHDIFVNAGKTMTKISHLLANHMYLTDLVKAGKGKWLKTQPEMEGRFVVPAAPEGSEAFSPLSKEGLWTTREIRDELNHTQDQIIRSNFVRTYLKARGLSKAAATVWNPVSANRNPLSNILLFLGGGHFYPRGAWSGVRALMAEAFPSTNKASREKMLRWARLGITHENVDAEMIRDIGRAARKSPDQMTFLEKVMLLPGKYWTGGDAIFKIMTFESLMHDWGKAHPEWSVKQLEEFCARRTLDQMPTYSRTPRIIKSLRFVPLADFPMWTAEVIRTTANNVIQIKEELADPRTRKIGLKHLAGLTAAYSIPTLLARYALQQSGMSGQDDEDMRHFVPSWSKYSALAWIKKAGRLYYVDIGFTDPYSYFKKAIVALWQGDTVEDKIVDGVAQLMEPFVDYGILVGKVIEAASNRTETGRQIRNPEADPTQQAWDIAAHIADAFKPGALRSLSRLQKAYRGEKSPSGMEYTLGRELAGLLGIRAVPVDIQQSIPYKTREFQERISNATYMFTGVAGRRGEVSEQEIIRAYQGMEQARRRIFSDMHEMSRAAVRRNVPADRVKSILDKPWPNSAGLSKNVASAIVNGIYVPYAPQRDRNGQFKILANIESPVERQRRQAVIEKLLRQTAEAQNRSTPTR